MTELLVRCLKAAEALAWNHEVIHKSDFPSQADFDTALEHLADVIQRPGEDYRTAYTRAFDSPQGRLLYTARETVPKPEPVFEREVLKLSPAEQKIADAVTKFCNDHRGCSPEKGLLRVLESDPELYRRYLIERGGV